MDNKYIKTQINKYHRMLEDMKAGNINLFEGLITEILIKSTLLMKKLQKTIEEQT